MITVFGALALFVYISFMIGTYRHLHIDHGFEWDLAAISFLWPLLMIVVVLWRVFRWSGTKAQWVVGFCYGNL